MSRRLCPECGAQLHTTVNRRTGKVRHRCLICEPAKLRGPSSSRKSPTQHQGQAQTPSSKHCPWCGSYVPPQQVFCNSWHRAQFVEKARSRRAANRKANPQRPPNARPLARAKA